MCVLGDFKVSYVWNDDCMMNCLFYNEIQLFYMTVTFARGILKSCFIISQQA